MSERHASPDQLRKALLSQVKPNLGRASKGLRARGRDSVRRLADRIFDRGLETSKLEVELDHFHGDAVWYTPSDWLDLTLALRKVPITPSDVFVDFGAGKGRIVYQAARRPFARVIGVEISAKLAQMARENIERNRARLACPNVEVVNRNAAEWDVPDDVTVAYFYHPFGGETFERVIDNIVASMDRRPRPVRIIYRTPFMEDYILSTGRFRLATVARRKPDSPRRIAIYDNRVD